MNALKKTLAKYFLSSDGTYSLGAISIAVVGVAIGYVTIQKLWPLDVNDIGVVVTAVGTATGLIGAYRRVGR